MGLQVRAYIVEMAGRSLAAACTIAIRYSSIRRQGFNDRGGEHLVLEYTSQRHRLLPLLSHAFSFHIGGKSMAELLARTEALVSADPSNVPEALIAEVHASSSGLKVNRTASPSQL